MRSVIFIPTSGGAKAELHDLPDPEPRERHVLVDVPFAGVNPVDESLRLGRQRASDGSLFRPGVEVAGTVIATGPSARRWNVGDRVFGLVESAGLADRVVVAEDLLVSTPAILTDQQAATIPEAGITAHDALFTIAGLKPGGRVLINGGNGGVGTAAIQIATAFGAQVTATCRDTSLLSLLEGLGATAALIGELDAGVDVHDPFDVIIELVGAPNVVSDLRLLHPRGHIVIVGVGGGDLATIPLRAMMSARASISGTTLRRRNQTERATAVRKFGDDVLPMIQNGLVAPLIDTCVPAVKVEQAFKRLQERGKRGNVVLDFTQ